MISFPKLESWNATSKVATIVATVDKKRILCRISMEVLKERFDASEDEPMQSLIEYRADIQEAAEKLIEREAYEEDGSILIRTCDF